MNLYVLQIKRKAFKGKRPVWADGGDYATLESAVLDMDVMMQARGPRKYRIVHRVDAVVAPSDIKLMRRAVGQRDISAIMPNP